MTIEIPMENITTYNLVEEITQRSDLSTEDLYSLLKHLLDFNLPYPFTLKDNLEVVDEAEKKELHEYTTEELANEFLARDGAPFYCTPMDLQHYLANQDLVPDHYLLLKADNLFEQEILNDLRETFTLMSK